MFTKRYFKYFNTSFLVSILISGIILQGVILTISHAASNITSDGTMGTTVTQAESIYNINGGTIKGTNQFHSFGLFSVGTGDTASFNGPSEIRNIIGRVTGGQQSVIDGILQSTITGANLYLLNPYGVLFGKNASLNLSGSFHASTADYLKLSDGGIFYSNPLNSGVLMRSSILTTAAPSAFGFLSNNPAPITIQDSSLQVPKGNTLSLVGGDINITNDTSGYLSAPSGQLNLISVGSPGEVNLSDFNTNSFAKLGNITALGYSIALEGKGGFLVEGENYLVDPGGTIIIRGGKLFFEHNHLSARGNPGGSVSIQGEQLNLDDTDINTGTRGTVNHPGTAVDIKVTNNVVLTNGAEIASSSFGAGRAGDVRITACNIQLGDDDPTKSLQASIGFYGDIGSRAFGSGRGGDVYITADNLTIKNGFFINTAALSWGDAGNVTVRANSLKLLDEGSISSNGLWVGKGGMVDVIATDILISGKNGPNVPNYTGLTGLAAQTGYWSTGGLLRVKADNLQILDAGSISTTLFSIGPGANIDITAKDILISGVVIDNRISPSDVHASIDARVIGTYASGTGGNISVVSDRLRVTNGGFIATGLYGNAPGNAGNITINTGSLELSDRGGVFASSFFGTGNSGNIDITAKDMRIFGPKDTLYPFSLDFTGLSTATNTGRGGDIRITSDSLILTDRSSIQSASYGAGPAGNIEVNSGNLEVLNGSNILASSFGSGDGGRIKIDSNGVLVSGVNSEPIIDISGRNSLSPSGIASQAYINGGNAGDVQITTESLQLTDGGRISTETFGSGNGGNIEVTANSVFVSGVNRTLREFLTSGGGDPKFASASLLTSANGFFSSDRATGNAGNIRITAGNVQIQDGGLITSETDTTGNGGNIEFIADRMNLVWKATVSAESSGVGDAGNIDITSNSLLMRDSSITTEAKQADGGNINIHSGYMDQLIDSKITASVGGGPDTVGGNITIDPMYVILNDSQIIANAYEGKGGNIRIIADVFLASPDSIVDASSALGIDGTVDIQAPISNISGTLAPMQGNFLLSEALLRDRCIAKIRGVKYNSLIVSGRDGLPIRPGSVLPSPIY